jgi:hypothetical protein
VHVRAPGPAHRAPSHATAGCRALAGGAVVIVLDRGRPAADCRRVGGARNSRVAGAGQLTGPAHQHPDGESPVSLCGRVTGGETPPEYSMRLQCDSDRALARGSQPAPPAHARGAARRVRFVAGRRPASATPLPQRGSSGDRPSAAVVPPASRGAGRGGFQRALSWTESDPARQPDLTRPPRVLRAMETNLMIPRVALPPAPFCHDASRANRERTAVWTNGAVPAPFPSQSLRTLDDIVFGNIVPEKIGRLSRSQPDHLGGCRSTVSIRRFAGPFHGMRSWGSRNFHCISASVLSRSRGGSPRRIASLICVAVMQA